MESEPKRFRKTHWDRIATFLILSAVLVLLPGALACQDDGADDDDDEVSDEDKEIVACNKIDECGFKDLLDMDDCPDFAQELSDWLMVCVTRAEGCRELAECFNLPEETL